MSTEQAPGAGGGANEQAARRGGWFGLAFPHLVALAMLCGLVWDGSCLQVSLKGLRDGTAAPVDPVCGMTVGRGLDYTFQGKTYSFCTAQCYEDFKKAPGQFVETAPEGDGHGHDHAAAAVGSGQPRYLDPVCGKVVDDNLPGRYRDRTYFFCSPRCQSTFLEDPDRVLKLRPFRDDRPAAKRSPRRLRAHFGALPSRRPGPGDAPAAPPGLDAKAGAGGSKAADAGSPGSGTGAEARSTGSTATDAGSSGPTTGAEAGSAGSTAADAGSPGPATGADAGTSSPQAVVVHTDPVCGKEVAEGPTHEFRGRQYLFCSDECLRLFSRHPRRYVATNGDILGQVPGVHFDVACGSLAGERFPLTWKEKTYYFSSPKCRQEFLKHPEEYAVDESKQSRWMRYTDPVCFKEVSGRYSFKTEFRTYYYCSDVHRREHRIELDMSRRGSEWALPARRRTVDLPPALRGEGHARDQGHAAAAHAAGSGGSDAHGSEVHPSGGHGGEGHGSDGRPSGAPGTPEGAAQGGAPHPTDGDGAGSADGAHGHAGVEGAAAHGTGSDPGAHPSGPESATGPDGGLAGQGHTGAAAGHGHAAIAAGATGTDSLHAHPLDGGVAGSGQPEPPAAEPLPYAVREQREPRSRGMHTMAGVPGWIYYPSIALVLVLSFGLFEWISLRRDRARNAGEPARGIDLLSWPALRRLAAHPRTRLWAQLPVAALFVLVLAAGLFGVQDPARNLAPLLTWTLWWGALVVLIMYAGKAWCFVCPWDALAGWFERLGRLFGRRGLSLGLRWPRALRNIWPATALFVVLTWIEIGFGVTLDPRVTAWLGLAMVALAVGCALVFERKSFCRYACLVGRISGLYALFAPVEIRARDRDRCRRCPTSSCFKGNERGEACPTFLHLGRVEQNTYCIQCLECVRTCEFDNVALNLRPWASDLEHHQRPREDEAYLSLMMLSLTSFHGLTMTGSWQTLMEVLGTWLGVGRLVSFSVGMTLFLVAPVAVYAALVSLSRRLAADPSIRYRDYFVRYAYALLPIALFYHLAHNSEHLLFEGPKVVALLSDPFGWGWNLLGTTGWSLPPAVRLPTLWGFQVFLVIIGHVYSLWAARRAAGALFADPRAALRSQLPMLAAMILYSVYSLWLLKQPMEMRTSAM